MQKISLNISYIECDGVDELDNQDRELLAAAEKAVSTAYAPYSQYYVGSALRLEDGRIIRAATRKM